MTARYRSWKRWVVCGISLGSIVVIVTWPVTTRFGIDYRVSSKRITLGEKAVHFISRDLQTRRLVGEVTRGASSGQEKLLQIFAWTVRHVQPTPPGFPVVDDHVLHIIIRGYGAPDQRTEAFALLASYSGYPATATLLNIPGIEQGVVVAVVQDGAKRYLFDIVHDLSFRNDSGQLADFRELQQNPQLVSRVTAGMMVNGVPYERYILLGRPALRTRFTRMEAQKPWPRLWQELGHLFGLRTE